MPELMSALHIKFSIGESTCEEKSRLLCPNICQHMCQNVWHMKFASIYVRKCKMSEDMSEFKHTSEYMSKWIYYTWNLKRAQISVQSLKLYKKGPNDDIDKMRAIC